jgi:hypothetical protein
MLNTYDWLRRCESGAELLATIKYFAKHPKDATEVQELGAPLSALEGPCRRCHLYARSTPEAPYCRFCQTILDHAKRTGFLTRHTVVLWGVVNALPKKLREPAAKPFLGKYLHAENRFLAILGRRKLKPWLQDLMLYHGGEIKGLVQIFPTVGAGKKITMGELLSRAAHGEPRLPPERLWVQFYSAPYQLLKPRTRDREGLLTFEAADFLGLLEMAEVFRVLLYPAEQQQLYELLDLDDPKEEPFYWGRFLGQLHQQAKDMLAAWRIRQWPKSRIKLLYELLNYVALPHTD